MQPTAPAFAFLGALTESIDQVVFAYGIEAARFIYLNPAFEAVFKRNRETLDLPALAGSLHAEDREYVAEAYEDLLGGQPRKPLEFRVLLPGGAERWLRVKPLLVEENGVRAIAGLAEDITDFKHYSEVELKFSHKKNAIIQMLSHDLAGPLGTIQSLSSLVTTRVRAYKDEPLSNVVGLITETSRSGLRLIKDFLEQEFLESAATALIKNRVNLVEKLTLLVEQYQVTVQNSPRQFTLSSSDPSVYANVDEVKFIQVVTNLVSNAVKFTPDDGEISIRVDDQEEAGTVRVTVRDNGIGIPEKYHAALFDKFTKARRPGLRQEPSTGLGMSIIKTVVEWHGGKIWFESEENQGTTFFVEIPRE
ncbi:MAG: Phosphate regulon sensor protein PhoR (SphS) [uncultured Cytophagales bacterium]|uniref:histidine kinase n=1 Tax=uncultured Cytophagales bacterium TaxID=158755 RepID=A0A6J4LJF4_9SPHI|nr:MAG: Phosphate regulon sensor protein PhoR (SphS) [uncultured Cytophagales bacterium]